MEALAVLRLSDPPRRNNHRAYSDDDDDEVAPSTPYASAPSSPRRAFTQEQEVEEAPLGEVRAAIPFAWELVPGTPRNEVFVVVDAPAVRMVYDEAEETEGHGSSTSCSSEAASSESLSRDSSKTDFDFVEPAAPAAAAAAAAELFSNGRLVTSLRLPPRLQHLRSLDSPCSSVDVSSSGSFKSRASPQSPRPSKLTALCGFTKTTDEETTTILGMQDRNNKRRSLSPLRCLNREAHFASDRSNSSVSSFSSSSGSSSGSSTNANSPQDSPAEKTSTPGSMLKDLLFTDLAMASGRSAAHLKPRQVPSKLELLQKHQAQWNKFAHSENVARPALAPQLSRPIARSRSASIDTHGHSFRKENIGRAVLANRFGMIYACLGMPSESP